MFGKPITLFTLFGFKVKFDLSWLLLALLITWSLASKVFPNYYRGLSSTTYWWMGVLGALGLFGSIVFHELWHSLIARKFRLPIKEITLFIFGGVANMEDEPRTPKAEFLMTIAGPLASVGLSGIFWGIHFLSELGNWPISISGVLAYLGSI